MKYTVVLALAAVGSALILPPQEVFADVAVEKQQQAENWYEEAIATKDNLWDSLRKSVEDVTESVKHAGHKTVNLATEAFDEAISRAESASEDVSEKLQDATYHAESWLESEISEVEDAFEPLERPPHHKKPHKRPHHRRPHHGHHKPNATIYELINNSKYTTKLAFFINSYPDIVKTLNTTGANFTVFVPTDKAFEKIPKHAPKPSKEELKALLFYHVVPGLYPAGRVLATHTVPTLFTSDKLGKEPLPQRLSFHISLRGLTVNFYSRIFSVNHVATNGILHAVDSVLVPPPPAIKIIDLLPGEFSTFELGLAKTGLLEGFNSTKHPAGTLFAPSNRAFTKLGPRANAFLFSQHGLKYLKALLKYHVAPKNVLYSDAFYSADSSDAVGVPKGQFHVELPTLLKERSLSVDIARFGGFITIRLNAFSNVAVQDGIAADGVIQVVPNVLFPPRKVGGDDEESQYWNGDEMEVDELVERLEPFVSENNDL